MKVMRRNYADEDYKRWYQNQKIIGTELFFRANKKRDVIKTPIFIYHQAVNCYLINFWICVCPPQTIFIRYIELASGLGMIFDPFTLPVSRILPSRSINWEVSGSWLFICQLDRRSLMLQVFAIIFACFIPTIVCVPSTSS
ncbi:MAG TPA: hypothetical protein VK787_02500 [Puia sp.]|nr:hypothetical protein [Puia sp.]